MFFDNSNVDVLPDMIQNCIFEYSFVMFTFISPFSARSRFCNVATDFNIY